MRVQISEFDGAVARHRLDGCLLLPTADLCFLDIREVGGDRGGGVEGQWRADAVGDAGNDLQPPGTDVVGDTYTKGPLGETVRTDPLLVAGLPGAAAAWLRDLRIHVGEIEPVGPNHSRLAEPQLVSVDLQTKRPQESRLTVVEA